MATRALEHAVNTAEAPSRTEKVRMPNIRSPRISGASFKSAMTIPNSIKKVVAKTTSGGKRNRAAAGLGAPAATPCRKKPILTSTPRTVKMAMEASSAKRLRRNGGMEYRVPRSVEPSSTTRSDGVAMGERQKARPENREAIMTKTASDLVMRPAGSGRKGLLIRSISTS